MVRGEDRLQVKLLAFLFPKFVLDSYHIVNGHPRDIWPKSHPCAFSARESLPGAGNAQKGKTGLTNLLLHLIVREKMGPISKPSLRVGPVRITICDRCNKKRGPTHDLRAGEKDSLSVPPLRHV